MIARRALAIVVAALLVHAPLAHAQDDEMPDGDVDLVEKPKPKKKEKEPKKREEKKKEEPKAAPPPKEERPKAPPKKEAPPKDDDDDILTVPKDDAPTKPAPKLDTRDVLMDEDESDEGGRVIGGDEEPADEPAPPPPAPKPAKAAPLKAAPKATSDDGAPSERARVIGAKQPRAKASLDEDAPPARSKVLGAASDDDDDELGAEAPRRKPLKSRARRLDTAIEEPDDEEAGGFPWVIAGATGATVLLLAGGGVGGYFLFDALSQKTGTIVVTPR